MNDDGKAAAVQWQCRTHGRPLAPGVAGRMICDEEGCTEEQFAAFASPLPPSPLGPLGQGAVAQHEWLLAYEAAGFSRAEGMQLVCCIMTAMIMKGSGSG